MPPSDYSNIFVSYRRTDVEFVKQLVEALRAEGREVWIDWEDIPPGSTGFTTDIKRGLEGADAFLCVLSPRYLESPYCVELELNYAASLNKKIVPIVYEKFDSLPLDVPESIQNINWIYFTPHAGQENTFEESLPKIITAMETDFEHVREHKRLLLRCLEWDEDGRNTSALLVGDELEQAETWLAHTAGKLPLPTQLHRDYITVSRKQATRRQRNFLIGVSFALATSIILAILSLIGFSIATVNENRAEAAEAEMAQRARAAEARVLAERLPDIAAVDPFLSYGLALALTEDERDISPIVAANVNEVLPFFGAIREFTGHQDVVNEAILLPDGRRALSGSDDFSVKVWETETGQVIFSFQEHSAPIIALEIDEVNLIAYSGSDDGIVFGWDINTGDILGQYGYEDDDLVSMALSADSSTLLTSTGDGWMSLWDVETEDTIAEYALFDSPALDMQFIDDSVVVVALDDGRLLVWDIVSETLNDLTEVGHFDAVTHIALSADGTRMLTSSYDTSVVLWDITTWDVIFFLDGHEDVVYSVAFVEGRNDGSDEAVSVSEDGIMILWDLERGERIRSFSGHAAPIYDVVVSGDGNTALTASWDLTLILWDISRSETLAQFTNPAESIGLESQVNAVDMVADGSRMLTAFSDGSAVVWSLDNPDNWVTFAGLEGSIITAAFSPDGGWAVSGSDAAELILWDAHTGAEIRRFAGHEDTINKVVFSADGQTILSGSADGSAILWDVNTGEAIRPFVKNSGVRSVAISADGTVIALGLDTGVIEIIDAETGEPRLTLNRHVDLVTQVRFILDGTELISTSADGTLIVWDMSTGAIRARLIGHTNTVSDVIVGEDGVLALSTSWDGTIILWDITTGDALRVFRGHNSAVNGVAATADFTHAVTGSNDGTARLWQISEPVDDLRTWAIENRQIEEVTCEMRDFYAIPNRCDESLEAGY
ncbi:MAG: TIR domain-containing protein [Aggregatilineales bacterium]